MSAEFSRQRVTESVLLLQIMDLKEQEKGLYPPKVLPTPPCNAIHYTYSLYCAIYYTEVNIQRYSLYALQRYLL
jgi:hypothetical protein